MNCLIFLFYAFYIPILKRRISYLSRKVARKNVFYFNNVTLIYFYQDIYISI